MPSTKMIFAIFFFRKKSSLKNSIKLMRNENRQCLYIPTSSLILFPSFPSIYSYSLYFLFPITKKIAGDRQNDLKDERRRAQMSAARLVLERSTMMLLTSSKVYILYSIWWIELKFMQDYSFFLCPSIHASDNFKTSTMYLFKGESRYCFLPNATCHGFNSLCS